MRTTGRLLAAGILAGACAVVGGGADARPESSQPASGPASGAATRAALATDGAFEQTVRRLVGELANPRFRDRQAATEELIRMGEAVLPVLASLQASADPEVRQRLEQVRYALAGWRDELMQGLRDAKLTGTSASWSIPDSLLAVVRRSQPRSGDLLLEIVEKPGDPLAAQAAATFGAGWDSMTAGQIERYLRASLRATASLRPRYPQGVAAMIGMQYGLAFGHEGLPAGYRHRPSDSRLGIKTVTIHTVDGNVYGKPFVYEDDSPGAGTGWVRVGELAQGRHTLRFKTEMSLNHGGQRVSVTAESNQYSFEVVDASAPDDLAADGDPKLDELVKRSLKFSDVRTPALVVWDGPGRIGGMELPTERQPQVTWRVQGGEGGALYLPAWVLTEALPVDLCFDVEFHEANSPAVHHGDPMLVLAGRKVSGYFPPRHARSLSAGRQGDVEVTVVLKASRAMALTNTDVKRYWRGTITSPPLVVRLERR